MGNASTIDDLLTTELAAVATSMFDDKGHMRIAKSKLQLKNYMKVEIFQRHTTVSNFFPG